MRTSSHPQALCALALLLLAGCAGPQEKIVSEQLAKSTRSWDGKPLPSYPVGQPEITVRRITIPAGKTIELHVHPVINAGVLTRGELTVFTLDGKRLHLKAGDALVELVNTAHYGKNEGKWPAEIVVVYAGTVGTPTSILK